MYASEKHPGGVTVMLWSPQNWGHPGGYAAACESARKTAL